MRFVVIGAGAIGGVLGARLFESGHDVVLVARGPHLEAMRERGLVLETPDGVTTLAVPVAGSPAEAGLGPGDVVLLCTKSQDTPDVLAAILETAPDGVPLVSVQNGVENERVALRVLPDVYGVCVMCPAAHLTPGVVQAFSSPSSGTLDIGRYPSGVDETAEAVAAAFDASTFSSEARPDIMRWKHRKLLMNLGNSIQAICGAGARGGDLWRLVFAEGEASLAAAGIEVTTAEEDAERRAGRVQARAIEGRPRGGGSTWQSFERRRGSVETDYLNGEIVLLGRIHGIPTPANALLQQLARRLAAEGAPPGSMPPEEVLALLAPAG
jgi:2-dehydropantoate 2-reductase